MNFTACVFPYQRRPVQIFTALCIYVNDPCVTCVCVFHSVQDKKISTSIPVLDLIDAIQPQSVNFELVKTESLSDEDKLDNAK